VLAILLGLLVGSIVGSRDSLSAGISGSSSFPLRAAVVVLGAQLPLQTVVTEGVRSLPVIALTLGACLLAARALGRALSIPNPLRTLVGVGTGICGASAIAAVTPVIEAGELDVGYAVATIFLFNVLAVLTFPPLGHLIGMSAGAFGLFAGTAVNDLSSVVATASAYSGSLHTAVIVKLARTLMIVPISIVLGMLHRRGSQLSARARTDGGTPASRRRPASRRLLRESPGDRLAAVGESLQLMPRFLIGFLLLAALRSVNLIPHAVAPASGEAATLLITIALAAVGLSIDIKALRDTGPRPILLGAGLWVTVTAVSLTAQGLGLG
jgi:uncharacterized membrane protein YadS